MLDQKEEQGKVGKIKRIIKRKIKRKIKRNIKEIQI